MRRILVKNLQLWQFDSLTKEPLLRHFITDRHSTSDEEEFSLSYSSSSDKDRIRANRAALAEALAIDADHLFFPSQVHQTRVVRVTANISKDELMETDALITNEKGFCLAVMSADCVPILLYDRKNRAVGAVHAGWRGTVSKILDKTLQRMSEDFGTQGQDLVVGIGPSVSQESYEVGMEVIEAVEKVFGKEGGLLVRRGEKANFDLWKANERQLLDFGVDPSRIEISELCTVINNHYFFSARKGDRGRFCAGLMVV